MLIVSYIFFLNISDIGLNRLGKDLGLASMRLWQRLIAIFMVIIFVPATLAAGMPLVYCPGADGHPGIEFAHAQADRPNIAAAAVIFTDAGLRDVAAAAPAGCVDVKLLSFTSVPQRSADIKIVPGKSPVLPGLALIRPDSAPRAEPLRRLASITADVLAARRTVVLHI